MSLKQYLLPSLIAVESQLHTKTATLMRVSQLMAEHYPMLDERALFDAFWQREQLGSTAIGHGVAIPHVQNKHLKHPVACFLRLEHPIDFGAKDKVPVRLVMGLIVPEGDCEQHLALLGEIAGKFQDKPFREACLETLDAAELCELMHGTVRTPVHEE